MGTNVPFTSLYTAHISYGQSLCLLVNWYWPLSECSSTSTFPGEPSLATPPSVLPHYVAAHLINALRILKGFCYCAPFSPPWAFWEKVWFLFLLLPEVSNRKWLFNPFWLNWTEFRGDKKALDYWHDHSRNWKWIIFCIPSYRKN